MANGCTSDHEVVQCSKTELIIWRFSPLSCVPILTTNSIPSVPSLVTRVVSPSPYSSPLSKPPLGRSSPSFSRLPLELLPPPLARDNPLRSSTSSSRSSPPRPLSSLSHTGSVGGAGAAGGVGSTSSSPGAASQAWWYDSYLIIFLDHSYFFLFVGLFDFLLWNHKNITGGLKKK